MLRYFFTPLRPSVHAGSIKFRTMRGRLTNVPKYGNLQIVEVLGEKAIEEFTKKHETVAQAFSPVFGNRPRRYLEAHAGREGDIPRYRL